MTTSSASRTPSESISCEVEGGGFQIQMVGEIDLLARPRLNEVIEQVTAAPAGEIFIDVTDVSFLGSEALSFFAALHAHVSPGHQVVLYGPNRSARRSLELTGFDQVLTLLSADEPREIPAAEPASERQ